MGTRRAGLRTRLFDNRATAWVRAGRRNSSCGGGNLPGGWTFDSVHNGRDAPAIRGCRFQVGIAETGTCYLSHRGELAVSASARDTVGRRSRLWAPRQIDRAVRRVDDLERSWRHSRCRRRSCRRRGARRQRIEHRFDSFDLRPGLGDIAILVVDVTPPVPAPLGVERRERTRRRLRIKHNQMIGIRPGVVAGIIDETPTDIATVLLAAMQRDMNAARRTVLALHGCKQDSGDIGRRFIDDTGYNAWADTNHLIVLYPQTASSSFAPFNPQACWDWWSYVNHQDSYVTKSGPQIKTIKAMLDALTARATPAAAAAPAAAVAPALLKVIDTSHNSVDLAWSPQAGVTAYRISRAGADGQFAVVAEVAGPSFG